jgi:ketosteroid isomerase-like protein
MAFAGEEFLPTMSRIKAGDRVILKRGNSQLVAAGVAVERNGRVSGLAERWLHDFDGWDLRAHCYVEWHQPEKPAPARGLTRSTIQRVLLPDLQRLTEEIIKKVPAPAHLEPEPTAARRVPDEEIVRVLAARGLEPSSKETLEATLPSLRELGAFYYEKCDWRHVREIETRTFLVVPLLAALGWQARRLKIELATRSGKVDVACFSRPYSHEKNRKPDHDDCELLIETKGFSSGLTYAPRKAMLYAADFPNCEAIAVSNGYCYKVFTRKDDGEFADEPSAYVNMLNPRESYPTTPDRCAGCLEALRLLLPGLRGGESAHL